MAAAKFVTVMLIPDGTEARRGFRIRQWMLKSILIGLAALMVGIVLFFSFYGGVLRRAAMADQLREENERLLRYQTKVKILEDNLNQTRAIVQRLTQMAGVDIEFPVIPPDSVILAHDASSPAVMPWRGSEDYSMPSGLPVQGFITQDFEVDTEEHFHPGIDIACAVGTPVLATASGEVVDALYDSTYGHVLIVQHNDSITTVYGHNSQLLVGVGDKVMAGGRVALSGNSGRSTAPHLHYEVRVHDKPIDPLGMLYDQKIKQ